MKVETGIVIARREIEKIRRMDALRDQTEDIQKFLERRLGGLAVTKINCSEGGPGFKVRLVLSDGTNVEFKLEDQSDLVFDIYQKLKFEL